MKKALDMKEKGFDDGKDKMMGVRQKEFDEDLNFMEEKIAKLDERISKRLDELLKDTEKRVITNQNVVRAVNMALSEIVEIKDGQVKMVLMNELVTGKISKIEVAMDEKITTCLDDCDEKVTTCFDQCADQFFQQSEAVERSLNKKMVTKLEEAMVKIEYNLMVQFHGETLDFDEFQRLPRLGRESVQRKKHKPR